MINSNLETPRPPHAIPQLLEPKDSEVRISNNPTLLPDDFMLSFAPIFLIRHPALVFPSWYKMGHNTFGADIDDYDFPVEVLFGGPASFTTGTLTCHQSLRQDLRRPRVASRL